MTNEIRMHAEQLHRALPDNVRTKIHIDDLYLAVKSPSDRGIERAKKTRSLTAIIGLGAGLIGFMIGSNTGAAGAWVGGIAAAWIGWSLSEKYFGNKIGDEVKKEVEKTVAQLISSVASH